MSQEWINLRVDDEKYVLDTIESAKNSKSLDDTWFTDDKETIISVLGITDTDKIGLMGHSLGGAVSVTVGRERDDIDAVIDMDGNMFGEITGIKNGKFEYYTDSYSVPLLASLKDDDFWKHPNDEWSDKNWDACVYKAEDYATVGQFNCLLPPEIADIFSSSNLSNALTRALNGQASLVDGMAALEQKANEKWKTIS